MTIPTPGAARLRDATGDRIFSLWMKIPILMHARDKKSPVWCLTGKCSFLVRMRHTKPIAGELPPHPIK
ncbi:MAG: hypothetical protein KGK15_17440 [Burkholderiales bacterium]|nr:hypothetical protein [Burkholderiales bacterium]MDE2290048.1 hypothetical protein [Burkholderiales bacterium]MDE2609684.1 hypothetical protein [Burkholderiales bacterium]